MKKNKTCKNPPTLKGLIIQKIYASETSVPSILIHFSMPGSRIVKKPKKKTTQGIIKDD